METALREKQYSQISALIVDLNSSSSTALGDKIEAHQRRRPMLRFFGGSIPESLTVSSESHGNTSTVLYISAGITGVGGNEPIHSNLPSDYHDVVVHVGISKLLEDDIGVCVYRRVELDEGL